jgi:2-enoate reductase
MIIGGGAAGMEAARVAALRGHQVVLYEKGKELGGHLLEASVPAFKKDVARLLEWFKLEIGSLDLEINLQTEISSQEVTKANPDVVIIASGSKPLIPEVPGIDKEKVATAGDLLLGKKKAKETVVVVGGGLIGCETALWLAQQGKKVTLVEMLEELMVGGIPVQHMNRMMLLDLLKFHNVQGITRSSLLEVTDEGVVLIDQAYTRKKLPADTVALAVGLTADQELYRQLRGQGPNLFLIGDSRRAQNIMNSVWDAYEVARMI